jgi:Capsular polysaccharide synthesis protein
MMNVWTYWEGLRSPDIELCLDTIRQHCLGSAKFHHITADNIDRYIPDGLLHPAWKRIPALGVKGDCVRAAVLAQYGGLYVDADTVMLKSPAGVIDRSKDCVYTMWDKPPARVIAGYVYCRPGSPIARAWLDGINRSLAEGKAG